MSGNEMPGTPGEGGIRRKPSYSEVLKSTPTSRPAPIDTDVARAMQEGMKATSATPSSGFWSAANASLGTGLTAPTPLFSPSIWSPVQSGTQSATVPRNLSWETATPAKATQPITTKTASPASAVGLGLQLGDLKATPSTRDQASLAKSPNRNITPAQSTFAADNTSYKHKQNDLANAQTKPFFRDGGVPLSTTEPLPQQPFHGSGGDLSREYTRDLSNSTTHDVAGPLTNELAVGSNQALSSLHGIVKFGRSNEDVEGDGSTTFDRLQICFPDDPASDWSLMSEISEHAEAADRDEGKKAPMITEEAHPRNFARTLMDDALKFACAFQNADSVVTAINPSHYAMTYGSRAVCVKTDFVENIHWSVQNGVWVVMDKVAERIMNLWDARVKKEDKVLFVFSINGQKSYCGLAEMAGPWKPAGELVEGFKIKKDGSSRTWGTMPLTWILIKNVSYYWFRDIKNPHSDQDIVNMWNGMHFPTDIAREVVERIIKRPHFTNVMAWRKDLSYDPYKAVLDASQIDPLAGDGAKFKVAARLLENGPANGQGQARTRNAGQVTQSTKGHALLVPNWRQPQQRQQEVQQQVAPTRLLEPAQQATTSATPPNLDGHASPPRHGQVVPCVLDKFGNYVPVTPGGGVAKNPIASANNSLISSTQRTVAPAFSQQAKLNNTPARGISNHREGSQGGNASVRGSTGGFNATGGVRIASTPHKARDPGSFPGYVGPQIRRMKSDMGLEDPFGTPRNLAEANAMPTTIHQRANAHALPAKSAPSLHRAASAANFVTQTVGPQTAGMIPAPPSFGATASNGKDSLINHAQGHSGGVALVPPSSYRPADLTPSRIPVNGPVHFGSNMQNLTTPTGHQIYPSPTDQELVKSPTEQVLEKKSDKSDSNASKVQTEYKEFLRRQQAIDVELMEMKFKEAGLAVPEYLKTANAVGQKGD